jgi:hypothetical protein
MMVVKRQCERCPAVKEIPVTAEDIKTNKYAPQKADAPPRYQISVAGKVTASYSNLCDPCEQQVSKAITEIAKKREKKSSTRG